MIKAFRSNNILNGNIEDIHKEFFLKSSIPEMASQWKVFQKIVMMEWEGAVEENSSLVKLDPIRVTSDGVCTWLAPLANNLQSNPWPTGAVSGENNGLKLMLDIESWLVNPYGNCLGEFQHCSMPGFVDNFKARVPIWCMAFRMHMLRNAASDHSFMTTIEPLGKMLHNSIP